jgi:hypothetical protein
MGPREGLTGAKAETGKGNKKSEGREMKAVFAVKWRWSYLVVGAAACGAALLIVVQNSPAKAPGDEAGSSLLGTQKLAAPDASRLAPKLTEAEKLVEAALAKPVNCKYEETPLGDVVADLAKQVDLGIELDEQSLEENGIDKSVPITFEAGPLSLRAVLKLLEVRHQLYYMPGLAGLRVTTQDRADEAKNQVLRVYPVLDLIEAGSGDDQGSEYRELHDLISQHVAMDSWSDNGGTGSISGFGGCLTVRQTLARHEEVSQILAGLRKLRLPKEKPVTVQASPGPTHEALAKAISGEASGSLNDFLAEVSAAIKTPIVVSLEGLENAGIDLAVKVTGAYRDQPGGKVLTEMLRPHGLTAAVFPEFVLVTSEDEEQVAAETRLYPVADLVDAKLTSPMPGPFGMQAYPAGGLIDLVVSSVDPDSWAELGGSGEIHLLNSPVLVVTTRSELHGQIESLLTSLRDQSKEKVAHDRKAEEKIVERTYPLYVARRELKVDLAKPKAAPAAAPANATPATPAPPKGPEAPAAEEDPFGKIERGPQRSALAQFGGSCLGVGGSMGGMGPLPMGGSRMPAQVTEPIPTADDVAALIRELLPDPSWKEEGVVLKPFHDVLIIRQRGPMLRKIEKLLGDIDAWHPPMVPMGGGMIGGGNLGGGGGGGMGGGGGGFF